MYNRSLAEPRDDLGRSSDRDPGGGAGPARRLSHETLVSVVVPCFDEEAVLRLLHQRLQRVLSGLGTDYEVIVVDDGSRDGSWEILEEIHRSDARWKALRFGRNFGHQTAIRAGLQSCRGDVTVILDADLQDPPEVVAEFLKKWLEGYDVIYGVRRRRKEGVLKRAAYFVFYRMLSRLSETDVPLDAGDFCAMDRRVVELVQRMPERRPFMRGLRSWVGFRQLAHPYDRDPRAAGRPKYGATSLIALAVDGLLSSSTLPLRFASYFGALMSAVAFVGIVLVLAIRLLPGVFERIGVEAIPGTTTLVICILLMGGVQLLSLGIMGEYLGRVYENVKGRPSWTVRESLGVPESLGSPPTGLDG